MSLVDTWAAIAAGAYSLSENGLYTLEAWKIFLSRLSDRGVYTVSRWYRAEAPDETGRMLSLAVAALLEMGASTRTAHLPSRRQASRHDNSGARLYIATGQEPLP